MSLATRCVACGTIFRVVQDQLKVSEGWVRCGRCDEVFNALEGLFDLDREAPPRWVPSTPESPADTADGIEIDSSGSAARGASSDREGDSHDDDWAQRHDVDSAAHADEAHVESPSFHLTDDSAGEPGRPSQAWSHDEGQAPDAELRYANVDDADVAHADALQAEHPYDPSPDDSSPAGLAPEPVSAPMPFVPMPAFVARAERDARWRQPGRLAGLAALILLLAVMLAAQAAHHFRDTLAARWPVARGPLEGWCALADCRLEPPRRIEDLVVENTGLTHAVAGTDTYRIAVTLRNRGNQLLALPFVDLTLTDNAGQLVARRALAPADFQRPTATIAANTELPLQALIATGTLKVSGYTVEIFYP